MFTQSNYAATVKQHWNFMNGNSMYIVIICCHPHPSDGHTILPIQEKEIRNNSIWWLFGHIVYPSLLSSLSADAYIPSSHDSDLECKRFLLHLIFYLWFKLSSSIAHSQLDTGCSLQIDIILYGTDSHANENFWSAHRFDFIGLVLLNIYKCLEDE